MFTTFDIILIITILGFSAYGLYSGLIKSIGFLIAGIAAVVLSMKFYLVIAELIRPIFFDNENISIFIGFLICFFVFNFAFGFVVNSISKIFTLPILDVFNRMFGFLFGMFEGMLIIGAFLFFMTKYPFTQQFIDNVLVNSKVAYALVNFSNILSPIIPNTLDQVQSVIKYWNI